MLLFLYLSCQGLWLVGRPPGHVGPDGLRRRGKLPGLGSGQVEAFKVLKDVIKIKVCDVSVYIYIYIYIYI